MFFFFCQTYHRKGSTNQHEIWQEHRRVWPKLLQPTVLWWEGLTKLLKRKELFNIGASELFIYLFLALIKGYLLGPPVSPQPHPLEPHLISSENGVYELLQLLITQKLFHIGASIF